VLSAALARKLDLGLEVAACASAVVAVVAMLLVTASATIEMPADVALSMMTISLPRMLSSDDLS